MAQILICDLCHKPITFPQEAKHYKVKEWKPSFEFAFWERIDVHEECVRKLFDAIKTDEVAMTEVQ